MYDICGWVIAYIKQLLMNCLYGYRGRELLSALPFYFSNKILSVFVKIQQNIQKD